MTRLSWLMASLLVLHANTLDAQRTSNDWLIKFADGTTVSRQEFEYIYQKNNGGWQAARGASQQDYRDYLGLFITFKRKVLAAQAIGLDTTAAFRQELASYLKQLAQPYLVQRQVLQHLVREAYTRSEEAVRVSHILIRVAENAPPADTLAAHARAVAIRDSVLNGSASFEAMAARHSDDPSARQFKGYLSWFTAFNFLYPFETAAYNTQAGNISRPVRTQYGYHLIKVLERRQIAGSPRLAHILVRIGENYPATDSAAAERRIHMVRQRLKAGADWAALVTEFSDDPNSKQRAGDLGTGYVGVPQLQDQRYVLQQGEVSEPFLSPYGWHIAKVTEVEPLKRFEDQEQQLKARVSRDPRAQVAETTFLSELKREYEFAESPAHLDKLIATAGEKYGTPAFAVDSIPATLGDLEMFRFADRRYSVADFVKSHAARRRNPNQQPTEQLRAEYAAFQRAKLLEYEETQLARKHPDYRNLAQEYRDGILLFTLTEQRVWRKAVEDTVGLRNFWQARRDSFHAPARVAVIEYRGSDSAQVAQVLDILNEFDMEAEVDSVLRARRVAGVRGARQVVNKGGNATADALFGLQPGQLTPILRENNRFVVYKVVEFRPAGPKTFEEAKPEAITRYQEQLEADWLRELDLKHSYRINEKAFKKLFRTP